MISHIIKKLFFSLGIGFLCQFIQVWVGSQYFNDFLKLNLINLLIALLAVNSATMGIVLTKIKDLVDAHGHSEIFKKTKDHMLLSVKEQITLIVLAIVLLTLSQSSWIVCLKDISLFLYAAIGGIFVYGMTNLYDTAKSVLIIIDYDPKK